MRYAKLSCIEFYFDFSEIVNNYWLKRGKVWQTVRFIFQFSQKLYIQF